MARAKVRCAFCGGRGRDPFNVMSALSACCVCKGAGVVEVAEPYCRCAHCQGSGAVKTLTYTACGGVGVNPLPPEPVQPCPSGRGSGDETSAPALPCLQCRGRGWVAAQ